MKVTSKSVVYLCCGAIAATIFLFLYFMFAKLDSDEIVYFEFGDGGEGTDIAVPRNYLIPGTPINPERGNLVWVAATVPDFAPAKCSNSLTCYTPTVVKIVIRKDKNLAKRILNIQSMGGKYELVEHFPDLKILRFSKYYKNPYVGGSYLSNARDEYPIVFIQCYKLRCGAKTEFDDDLQLSYSFDFDLLSEWSTIDLGVRRKVAEFVRLAEKMR